MPRRRWWPLLGAGAAVLLFGLMVTGATWYGLSHRVPPAPRAPRPASIGRTNGSSPSVTGGSPLATSADCAISLLGGACPAKPTCFGRLTVNQGVATARSLPCTGTHTWEVFALGTLPQSIG